MQNWSECFCSSINWFFCICKNWVEVQFSFSPTSWIESNLLICVRRLWHPVILFKMLPSLFSVVVSISGNIFFQFCLALGSLFFKSTNKRCIEMTKMRVSEENWFLHKVWRNGYRYRDGFSYPSCCVYVIEGLRLDTKRFKVEYCWAFDEFLFTRVFKAKRVKLVTMNLPDLKYIPGRDVSLSNLIKFRS